LGKILLLELASALQGKTSAVVVKQVRIQQDPYESFAVSVYPGRALISAVVIKGEIEFTLPFDYKLDQYFKTPGGKENLEALKRLTDSLSQTCLAEEI